MVHILQRQLGPKEANGYTTRVSGDDDGSVMWTAKLLCQLCCIQKNRSDFMTSSPLCRYCSDAIDVVLKKPQER